MTDREPVTDRDKLKAAWTVILRWQARTRGLEANRLYYEMTNALTMGIDLPPLDTTDMRPAALSPDAQARLDALPDVTTTLSGKLIDWNSTDPEIDQATLARMRQLRQFQRDTIDCYLPGYVPDEDDEVDDV